MNQTVGDDAVAEAPRLDALAETLAQKRTDAVNGRAASGIEDQWTEDEEFYQGIDDANRSHEANTWGQKPPGQMAARSAAQTRSTVFPNVTRPYVDAAAARIADMLLPTDDRSWALKPTPIPDLVGIASGQIPASLQSQMAAASGGNQANVDQMAAQIKQQAAAIIKEASDKAEKAQTRIEDWLVEGQWHAEVRKMIEDSARIGTGVLKGPVPVKRRVVALSELGADGQPPTSLMQRLMGGIKSIFNSSQQAIRTLIVKEEIKPASKRIDPWNFFPDEACGENIHNGSGVWERDFLTRRQLEDLQDEKQGYLVEQIVLCLEEGPQKEVAETKKEPDRKYGQGDDKRFEIWYYHGNLDRDDMLAAGCQCEEGQKSIPAMVTMVNDHVIKAVLNPLDSGDFPYDVMPWQRKSGMPWGNGVSRQGRTPQRIVIAAVRNMMDNAGLSAGAQIVIGMQIEPADGNWTLTPRKIWRFAEDADNDDVRKAMAFFEIPSRQKELLEIVNFGLKLMEDSTGLPMLLQGQQGSAPDTVGGMTMLNNNASSVLRRLARTFDDCVTEPHIRRYYTWLLQHGEDEEKGDFSIDARGSTALVERDLQNQQIPQLLTASNNPVFGIDPKKTMNQFLRSQRFDPKNFEFDDKDWEELVKRLGQKPQDPKIQVAQLREQGDTQRLQMTQKFDAEQNTQDHQVELMLGRLDERIEAMKLTGAKEIKFDELKVALADTAMKLKTQRDLSAQSAAIDIHKHSVPQAMNPPTEPAGRAKTGEAFQS